MRHLPLSLAPLAPLAPLALLTLLSLSTLACDEHDHDHDTAAGAEAHAGSAHAGDAGGAGSAHAGDSSSALTCDPPAPAPTEEQLMAMGGGYHIHASALNPATPAKGANALTLMVTDEAGAPQSGLSVTLEPFMPAHGHGTSPATFAAAELGEGMYRLEGVNLIMAGAWDLRFTLAAAGVEDVTLTLSVCVNP